MLVLVTLLLHHIIGKSRHSARGNCHIHVATQERVEVHTAEVNPVVATRQDPRANRSAKQACLRPTLTAWHSKKQAYVPDLRVVFPGHNLH